MKLPRPDTTSRVTITSLAGANLLLLIGAVQWGWRPLDLLLLYWLENGVIAAFNVPKVLLAVKHSDDTASFDDVSFDWDGVKLLLHVFLTCFSFLLVYGFFWIANGLIVLLLALLVIGSGWTVSVSPFVIILGLGSLLASHVVSFVANYLFGEEYRNVTPRGQMEHLYGRVAVLYVTIVLGVAIETVGSPVGLIALLVVLKTGLDVRPHLRDRSKANPDGSDRNTPTLDL